MSFQTFEHTSAYPLFGAKFINEDTFVVSGGGGEGRHGIPNEIGIFKITQNEKEEQQERKQINTEKEDGNKDVVEEKQRKDDLPELLKTKKLELISSYTFDKNCTDAPMSLDLYNDKIFVGCSDSKDLIEKNSKNESLKVLKISSDLRNIEMDHKEDIFKSKDPQSYIKKIQVFYNIQETDKEGDLTVVCLNSDDKSKILIDDYGTKNQCSIEELSEIKDFTILRKEGGSCSIFYITKKEFKTYSVADAASETILLPKIEKSSSASKNYQLLKIISLTSNELLVIGAYPGSRIIFTFIYDIAKNCIVKYNSSFLKGIKSVNCAAFKVFKGSKNNGLLALGTSDLSVILFNVSLVDFQIDRLFEFKKLHTFALTNVIISPNIEYVVSISAANSIHVIELPEDERDLINLKNSNGYLYVLLLLIVLLIAHLLNEYLK